MSYAVRRIDWSVKHEAGQDRGRKDRAGWAGVVTWLLLAAAVLSEVTASLCLKGAMSRRELYVVVVAGYALSFVMLSLVLQRGLPLGMAYGIWAASGVVLTAVVSWLVFSEPLTPLMGMGIVLVAAGVLLIELGATH